MIAQHLEKLILSNFKEEPTRGQKVLFEKIASYIYTESDDEVFLLTGYAGTGKTSAMAAIIKTLDELKINTILMAPTGRAAKVLSSFSGKDAHTIHRRIYKQRSSKDGMGKFVLGKNLTSNTIFIVDESSMIGNQSMDNSIFGSGNLLNDLLEYVYGGRRCKLILIGDSAQLPPVGYAESPALNTVVLKEAGFSCIDVNLSEVVRQSAKSGILFNASHIRKKIVEDKIFKKAPEIKVEKFTDIHPVTGTELIESLNESFGKYGIEDTIVVTRSNKRANLFNAGIRQQILFREEQISKGDYLMVVKNNYFWGATDEELGFIANGDIVQIISIGKHEERYGFNFVNAKIRLVDCKDKELEVKLLLNTLDTESASLSTEENKKMFYAVYEDYQHLQPKKKGYDGVKNDPYFNALQVKFAYAVTCHKAQGGQWKAVYIDQGYYTEDMLDAEYLKWMYTAFTRATEHLFLVNFHKDFLKEI